MSSSGPRRCDVGGLSGGRCVSAWGVPNENFYGQYVPVWAQLPPSGGSASLTLSDVSESVARRSGNSPWLVLIALFLGLVLGAGAVGMIWFVRHTSSSSHQIPRTDAAVDAVTACADLARVPASSPSADTMLAVQVTPAAITRLAGAATLAQAAATEDVHYRPLADAMTTADRLVEAWPNDASGQAADVALANARTACANP